METTKQDLPFMLTDLIQGDNAVAEMEGFSLAEQQDIIDAMEILISNPHLPEETKKELMLESWRVHYRQKPPTIEEFLTQEWIGPTADSIYPNVREILTSYWQPNSQYRHLILGAAIGTGKSFTSTLSSLYVTTHLWHLRNPKQFFGLSQATSIVHGLISFSMEKAGQLLLQPFMQILLSTPKFRRVKQEENLIKKQNEYPDEICWTTAGKMGVLQFNGDIHYMLASSPQKLLGLNMISATMSELSFFLDQGFSADYIWRIYNDAKSRIKNRFGERYFAGTIMDSSPNDMEESPIDKYIFQGRAEEDLRNMVVTGSHWEHLGKIKDTYRGWRNSAAKKLNKKVEECTLSEFLQFGDAFPVYRGSAGEPPRILSEDERDTYQPDEIYDVPIDLKQNFEDDLLKSVKDFCGWPAGSSGKLFNTWDPIEDMFVDNLNNIYTSISAPNTKPSKGLIWGSLHRRFWTKLDNGKYEFYRAPTALRYIHVDQAETNDMLGLSMVHPETTREGTIVYVTDFTIGITAGKDRINLEAVRYFISDMIKLGGIRIGKITFDQYQSSSTLQYLKERDIPSGRLSVDRTTAPYMAYITLLNTRSIKCGRNIFLKNNIKSLQEVTSNAGNKKIDHKVGKCVFDDGANWEASMMGINAKDLSDSHCGAIYNALNEFHGVPKYMWDPRAVSKKAEDLEKNLKESLGQKYGLSF